MIFVNKRRGFTVVELLIVIAIASLISSIAFASIRTAREKSRDAKRVASIKQIQSALELYFNTNNSYPTGLYGIGATDGLTAGGHISSVPYDPSGTTVAYKYAYCTTPGRFYYHLGASLERQDNLSLNVDRDCNSATPNCAPGGCITYSSGFNGGSGPPEGIQKCDAAHAGNYCYDVIP